MLPILAQKLEALESRKQLFLSTLANYNFKQLHYKATPEAWCMLQVAQHILASEKGTLFFVNNKPALELSTFNKFKAFFLNTGLIIFLKSPFKFKAPKVQGLSPEHIPTLQLADIEQQWAEIRGGWERYLGNFEAEKLNKVVFNHPVGKKMTISQTLNFLYEHLGHHILQLQRIGEGEDFKVLA